MKSSQEKTIENLLTVNLCKELRYCTCQQFRLPSALAARLSAAHGGVPGCVPKGTYTLEKGFNTPATETGSVDRKLIAI